MSRRLLVTNALPYANGPLHMGHLLGYIQADIWVRAQRMNGNKVVYVCADDAHGTPIMLAAEKAGVTPEAFIAGIREGHEADFAAFGVAFDQYHTTHSEENRELATLIYTRLRDAGYIARRSIQQLFDPEKEMFLPDRYIKGVCPNCGTPDQYGDNCEHCGATYAPTDLINPYSVMSGATPVLRDSEHYFFELGKFEGLLRDWFAGKLTRGKPVANSGVAAKLREWLDGGLKDWDISRDAPYFGFPIPDAPGKFFYVWLDAPVGYLASFKALCDRTRLKFDDFLAPDSSAEMHHFIGKDIINFHGLFWPAMLHGAGFRTPTALHVNGYLTVNGAKMSKSRGTFIQARTYLDAGLHPGFLRYYFASMLSDAPVDVDLDLKAFEERVNSHLVGKWVNIASRTAGFVHKYFGGRLAPQFCAEEITLWNTLLEHYDDIAALYESGDFAEVTRRFVLMADLVNGHIAAKAPWSMAKDESRRDELHQVCSFALTAFRLLAGMLKPILPITVAAAEQFLAAPIADFDDARAGLRNHAINAFEPLLGRIDPKRIEAMVEASKDSLGGPAEAPSAPKKKKAMNDSAKPAAAIADPTPTTPTTIGIDDFARLDLRIGKVTACEFVDGSDKLLRFELDAGALGTRQIFSGIRAAYAEPEKLVGRNVVFIANLAPRKMRFGLSEGMILSAGDGGSDLFLLDADQGAQPGATVR
ncbi:MULTISPECIES: methionine--tRNA ligase [unclassified Rhodanobacter]|uniref:methionine--tRNA ligase n=1 Tax=unclassified Rhodanobacter TaxID=2621553 RepID=UPI001BDE4C51|nr:MULTISPECIES: methionine--tRNA ligase [unclassified Rhodanobacter]MBT2142880.1 methionine--tRNA ligase [Rhodanobacter sp. LX-99]MBT2148047.1 methionine--tRNA ligase [Rhodanobacter sp. LX-100]